MKANANNTTVNNSVNTTSAAKAVATIEQEIDSIYRDLQQHSPEGRVVTKEGTQGRTSCRGMILVFDRNSLARQKSDASYRACPEVRYAFYPDACRPERLGSVAIYGDNVATIIGRLKHSPWLFGHRVVRASIERGRRPFVDVRFAV